MFTKSEIRARVRASVAGLPTAELAAKSRVICAHVIGHPAWTPARRVALFSALPGEVDLSALWAARGPRQFYFPRVQERELEFCRVEAPGELVRGNFGVLEPSADAAAVPVAALDLVLIPGLAFGRDCSRLGRGGGFYDRALAASEQRAPRIGVCFAAQLFATLPTEPHDQPMDGVITELGVV